MQNRIITKPIELKPCPYCGRTSTLCVMKEAGDYAVVCDYQSSGCGGSGGYRESAYDAKIAWNQRAGEKNDD